jgi:hypothetical protein
MPLTLDKIDDISHNTLALVLLSCIPPHTKFQNKVLTFWKAFLDITKQGAKYQMEPHTI